MQTANGLEIAREHLGRGEFEACRRACEEVLRQEPDHPEALYCIGLAFAKAGAAERALAALEKAVALCPANASWRHSLGVAYGLAGRWKQASSAFHACLNLDPRHIDARAGYASALLECGRLDEALAQANKALCDAQGSAFLHRTLGRILAKLERPADAAHHFRECLRLDPRNTKNLESAADFFQSSGEESLAAQLFDVVCEQLPEAANVWSKAAGARLAMGTLAPALAALAKALALDPGNSRVHSGFLYALIMDPAQTGETLLAAHRQWQAAFSVPRFAHPFVNSPDPERRIRLGILSGELSSGSSDFFLPPILRHHDRQNFELVAYSAAPEESSRTKHYRALFDRWRDVGGLSDREAEAAVREDQIDILLDVSGHLPHMRLGVFAARAAPVQVAYPRYPCTTGLDVMDYRITDRWADPPGLTEKHYCETLMRLPGGYLAYQPPDDAPPVTALPARANGYITFGCFQTPLKLNAGVLDALAATLLQVPQSRILFHHSLGDFNRPGRFARQRIEDELNERGIDPARLMFRGPLPLVDHLALLGRTDIALDAFPYSGQTTTCECLWMGVPVVTLAGARFSARVSASILHRSGLGNWVAATAPEFAGIAAGHASDLPALCEMRRPLRDRFAASLVFAAPRVTRELETVYRQVWRTWCGSRPQPIETEAI